MSPSELATINVGLGRVFARFRTELGLSQTAYGDLFGFSQVTVSDIEKGKRALSAAEVIVISQQLANALPGWDDVAIRREFHEGRFLRLVATDGASTYTSYFAGIRVLRPVIGNSSLELVERAA